MTINIGKIKKWLTSLPSGLGRIIERHEYTSVYKYNGRTLDPVKDSAIIARMEAHLDHLDRRLDRMNDMLDRIPNIDSFFK